MSHKLLDTYAAARNAVFNHVGLEDSWTYSAIDDCTDMGWFLNDNDISYWDSNFVLYAGELRRVNQNNDVIAVGSELSLVLCDLGMGGDAAAMVFDNSKQVKDYDDLPEEIKDQL